MKQEDFLAAVKKQQSLIRKLIANRKRRAEVLDELTQERYEHLRGRFFKADGEPFGGLKGCTLYIAGIHASVQPVEKGDDSIILTLTCRIIGRNMPFCGITFKTGENGGVDFCTRRASFDCEKDLDAYFAPLFVSKEKAVEEYNEIFGTFMDDFFKKC